MDLTFSGAGFMGCYYFGVVDCWKKYIPRERVNRAAGASAGSLIAAYYLMDLPLRNCLREIIAMTEEIRSRPLGVFDRSNQMVDVLPKLLDRLFPDDAHKELSGRLHVCMTRLKDMKKVIVNEFDSKKDLIDALNCSCFIPVWSGNHVSTYKGEKYIDGGFSDNLPVFDENTIRICCFAGQTDISPNDRFRKELLSSNIRNTPLYFSMANFRRFSKALWPPTVPFIIDLIHQGFHDTKQFILDNDLIQCQKCYLRFKSSEQGRFLGLNPTISPGASPAISRVGSLRRQPLSSSSPNIDDNNNNNNTKEYLTTSGYLQAANSDHFQRLLTDKLKRSRSPDSLESQESQERSETEIIETATVAATDTSVPSIVIIDDEVQQPKIDEKLGVEFYEEQENSIKVKSSRDDKICKPEKKKSRKGSVTTLNTRRRSSQVGSQNELARVVVKDKFTFAPNLLPSCPPSPNLNRHCNECIRLRQAARNDHVEDKVRQVAESFCDPQPIKENRIRSTLTSPLRWISKQLRPKHSYKFDQMELEFH